MAMIGVHHNGGMSIVVVILAIAMSVVIIGMEAVGSAYQNRMAIIHLKARTMGSRSIITVMTKIIHHSTMIIMGMVNLAIIMDRETVVNKAAQIIMVGKVTIVAGEGSRFIHHKKMAIADIFAIF